MLFGVPLIAPSVGGTHPDALAPGRRAVIQPPACGPADGRRVASTSVTQMAVYTPGAAGRCAARRTSRIARPAGHLLVPGVTPRNHEPRPIGFARDIAAMGHRADRELPDLAHYEITTRTTT